MSRNPRLKEVFSTDKKLLSVFTTAGYPSLDATKEVLTSLNKAGVDFIELGFPFSDPVADGETIQRTNTVAIENGMSLEVLFSQLREFRKSISMPIILMGYLNPVIQFGVRNFLEACTETGVDALIIPDLPLRDFKNEWEAELEKRNMSFIFLITPQTSDERIREIDNLSDSFIYAVSSQAVTGGSVDKEHSPEEYYKRLMNLGLKNPVIVGFGISDKSTFQRATEHHKGAIIGSAFLRALETGSGEGLEEKIGNFIAGIRG